MNHTRISYPLRTIKDMVLIPNRAASMDRDRRHATWNARLGGPPRRHRPCHFPVPPCAPCARGEYTHSAAAAQPFYPDCAPRSPRGNELSGPRRLCAVGLPNARAQRAGWRARLPGRDACSDAPGWVGPWNRLTQGPDFRPGSGFRSWIVPTWMAGGEDSARAMPCAVAWPGCGRRV